MSQDYTISSVALVAKDFPLLMDRLPSLKELHLSIPENLSDARLVLLLDEMGTFFKPSQALERLSVIAHRDVDADQTLRRILFPSGSFQYPNLTSLTITGVYVSQDCMRMIFMKCQGMESGPQTRK